ncbi:MAG: DUF47 family protein [Fibrobacterota bacterium]
MKFNPLDILLPRETKFYAFMNEQVDVFIEGSRAFKQLADNIQKLEDTVIRERVAAIKELEHQGDEVEHRIIDELHKTFITPIDREDIHSITIQIDRALDILNSTAQKFDIYLIRSVPPNVCKFADIIVEMALELRALMKALAAKANILPHVEKLHVLENTADHLFHWSMAELFDGSHNPIDIIKFKEIYEQLEGVTDAVDYVGKLVRGILVKLG